MWIDPGIVHQVINPPECLHHRSHRGRLVVRVICASRYGNGDLTTSKGLYRSVKRFSFTASDAYPRSSFHQFGSNSKANTSACTGDESDLALMREVCHANYLTQETILSN